MVVQRLTVTPAAFFSMKFVSRSSLIARAILSKASSQEMSSQRSRLRGAGLGLHEVLERRALRTERSAVGRMVGVTLDVDQLGRLSGTEVALGVHQNPAGDRTVGAHIAGFSGRRQFERADMSGCRGLRGPEAHGSERGCRRSRAGELQEAAAGKIDVHSLSSYLPCGSVEA
jgi:hypothetical protein